METETLDTEATLEQGPPAPEKRPAGPPPLFNRSAIRRQALKVSIEARNGKFKRVSQEFIDNVIASIESQFRKLDFTVTSAIGQVDPGQGVEFLTGEGKRKLAKQFNIWIAREIHRQSNNVRVGQTL